MQDYFVIFRQCNDCDTVLLMSYLPEEKCRSIGLKYSQEHHAFIGDINIVLRLSNAELVCYTPGSWTPDGTLITPYMVYKFPKFETNLG